LPLQLQVAGEVGDLAKNLERMSVEVESKRDQDIQLEKMQAWQTTARKIAHEIKNPLTPIVLAADELTELAKSQTPALSSTLEEIGRMLKEESGALGRMVKEFSAFARLPRPILEQTTITAILESFLSRNYGWKKDVAILPIDDRTTSNEIWADKQLLHQVLYNLVNNARLARSPVEINFILQESDTHYILDVQDNGPGVSSDVMDRIFDAYVTTRSTGDKVRGMGLGLTISRQIIEQHHGEIFLFRNSSDGAIFRIKFRKVN
jgi:nitrogen fixation/metabolism regulation signal transduction histidine kinase